MKAFLKLSLWAAFALAFLPAAGRAQSFPPAWISTASYTAGDIVQYGGNWYRSVKALAAHGPYPSEGFGSWELNYVRSNTTLVIGVDQPFTSLQDAWAFALEARIADGAYLHLDISTAKGTFNDVFSGPFSLDHAFGAKISIIGDNSVGISLGGNDGFAGNGLTIDSGHNLSLLSDVLLDGTGTPNKGAGISATGNASIYCTSIQIQGFMVGAQATQGASLEFDGNSLIGPWTKYGLYASQNANVTITSGTQIETFTGQAEIYAISGANVIAEGVDFGGGPLVGVDAEDGATIDIAGCSIGHLQTAVVARNHAYVNATNATFSDDNVDLQVVNNGVINATGVSSPTKSIDTGTGSYIY